MCNLSELTSMLTGPLVCEWRGSLNFLCNTCLRALTKFWSHESGGEWCMALWITWPVGCGRLCIAPLLDRRNCKCWLCFKKRYLLSGPSVQSHDHFQLTSKNVTTAVWFEQIFCRIVCLVAWNCLSLCLDGSGLLRLVKIFMKILPSEGSNKMYLRVLIFNG